MNPPLLSAHSLSRSYGNHLAVSNVSFSVNKGEVLGFLGPNGAGKSTTMKMLSGNLAPHHGEITINGYDLIENPKQAKAQIGFLPEQPPLYKELSVVEFLNFCARINQVPRTKINAAVDTVIQRCGLSDVTKRLIGHLSKGYQQRVGIAQAIIHTPSVVILDEPTAGLDPIQIIEIRQLIRDIATEHSVILSTHILPEVQTLCDRVQIIHQGQLLFNDTIEHLSQQMKTSSLLLELSKPPVVEQLKQLTGVLAVEALSTTQFRLHYHPDNNPTESLLNQSVSQHWQLQQLTPEHHSLEDVFMKIIKNEKPSTEQVA
ncbi:ABC transporter ATP-binding protein [Methylophaga sp. 42_25_T18]|nr:ABC transporter ATP-binding protein [Methylophaga sp. 42_25_T18]OUR89787.1 ABC transporter ATP-binding protein [Methylophaga sp. 42_8_T64]